MRLYFNLKLKTADPWRWESGGIHYEITGAFESEDDAINTARKVLRPTQNTRPLEHHIIYGQPQPQGLWFSKRDPRISGGSYVFAENSAVVARVTFHPDGDLEFHEFDLQTMTWGPLESDYDQVTTCIEGYLATLGSLTRMGATRVSPVDQAQPTITWEHRKGRLAVLTVDSVAGDNVVFDPGGKTTK